MSLAIAAGTNVKVAQAMLGHKSATTTLDVYGARVDKMSGDCVGGLVILGYMNENSVVRAAADGCYEAGRAAALSGVPLSTVYWWAREGVVIPTVSPVREMLWSYSDLMALRIVSWLRRPKEQDSGEPLPSSPMPKVRRALATLHRLNLDPWSEDLPGASPLRVDRAGDIFVVNGPDVLTLDDQPALLTADVLDLTGPFSAAGASGPDLLRPRPHLRIVPARVAGEPHVARSRLTTQTLAALAARGYGSEHIAALYDEPVTVVDEAIDLERQLTAA